MAAFNGWTIGTFGILTVSFGYRSPPVLVLGVGMLVVARNELRGGVRLRALDPTAPRLLGRNQMGLMGLIVVYSLWSLMRADSNPDPQLQSLVGLDPGFIRAAVTAVYVGVIVGTLIFQGLNARYYFKRGPMMDAYLAETPDWVVALQRSGLVG